MEKNINYRDDPVTYRKKSKKWSQTTGMRFFRMNSIRISGDFYSRITEVTIHPYYSNNPVMDLMSPRLFKIWWDGLIKMMLCQ